MADASQICDAIREKSGSRTPTVNRFAGYKKKKTLLTCHPPGLYIADTSPCDSRRRFIFPLSLFFSFLFFFLFFFFLEKEYEL